MMKKFAGCIAVLAVLACASGAFAAYYDGSRQGTSETDAYLIENLSDLNEFRQRVNNGTDPAGKYYRLTQDITLNGWGDTIGNNSYPFKGHFNGDGNIITYASYSNLLFGVINSDGVAVKNLRINGDISNYFLRQIESDYHYVTGGIAACLEGGSIESCIYESGTVGRTAYSDRIIAGGIAGYVGAGGYVKSCVFRGNGVTAGNSSSYNYTTYAGGIVGWLAGGKIDNCTVTISDAIIAYTNGETGTDTSPSYAGGIAAYALGETNAITNNKVTGKISSKQYGGGIVGYMSGGNLTGNQVKSGSEITANFTGGGIAGYLGNDGVAENNSIALTSSITVNERAVGGILGRLASGTVKNNYAYTMIQGGASYKGTIIGEVTGLTKVITDNYYNAGNGAEHVIGYDAMSETYSDNGANVGDPSTLPDSDSGNNSGGNSGDNSGGNSGDNTGGNSGDNNSGNSGNNTGNNSGDNSGGNTPTSNVLKIDEPGQLHGEVKKLFSYTFTANEQNVTWSVDDRLPKGLVLNSSTGLLSGQPEETGTYIFKITATSGTKTASTEVTLTVTGEGYGDGGSSGGCDFGLGIFALAALCLLRRK